MKIELFFLSVFLILCNSEEALSNSKYSDNDDGIFADEKKELEAKELKYLPIVKAASAKYKVDISWLMAIIKVESDFNHKAISPKGARGLMQLMPETADDLGVKDPFEPRKNIYGGAKYFAEQIKTFGRIELALAAYNAGPGLVKRLRRVPLLKETIFYIAKVLDYQKQYSVIITYLSPL